MATVGGDEQVGAEVLTAQLLGMPTDFLEEPVGMLRRRFLLLLLVGEYLGGILVPVRLGIKICDTRIYDAIHLSLEQSSH